MNISCIISLTLLLSMIFTSVLSSPYFTKKVDHNLKKTLDDNQAKEYQKIVSERLTLYFYGIAIGVVVGLIVISVLRCLYKTTLMNSICWGIVTLFIVLHLYYILSPKSKYMVTILNTQEQRDEWIKVYRTMQYRHYGSFACALVITLLLLAVFPQMNCDCK
jgi:uncharacterized protein YacL